MIIIMLKVHVVTVCQMFSVLCNFAVSSLSIHKMSWHNVHNCQLSPNMAIKLINKLCCIKYF